jgi:hypothetical protein
MRFLRLSLGFLAIGTALGTAGACSRTERAPGVLMLSVQPDISAGHDKAIQAIGLYVRDLDRGRTLFQLTEPVAPDGSVKFPATLAIVGRSNPGASVRIRVVGFRSGQAQVMRDAVTTIPTDRVALLSLPLRWVNYEKSTGTMPQLGSLGPLSSPLSSPVSSLGAGSLRPLAGEDDPLQDPFLVLNYTECKGETTTFDGACISWKIDSSTLPDFVESEVFGGGLSDGGGGKCFDTEPCFVDAAPLPLDAGCVLPKPAGDFTLGVKQGLGGQGACAGDGCIIPLDPENDEGWKTDGASVRIAPGTCKRMLDAKHTLVVSTRCGSKTAGAPLCGEASIVGNGTDLPVSGESDGGDGGTLDGAPDAPSDAPPGFDLTTGDRPTQIVVDSTSVYFVNRGCKVSKADKQTLGGTATPFGTQLTGSAATDVGCKIAMTPNASALILGKIGGNQLDLFAMPAGTTMPKPSMSADTLGALAINQTTLAWLTSAGTLRFCTLTACTGAGGTNNIANGAFLSIEPAGGAYATANQTIPGARVLKCPFFTGGAGALPIANTTGPVGPVFFDLNTLVYWTVQSSATKGGGIFASLKTNDGTTPPIPIITNENMQAASNPEPHEFVISGSFVFWTNADGEVRGAPLAQNAIPVTIASKQNAPHGIAVDANDVYWTATGDNVVRKIARPAGLK